MIDCSESCSKIFGVLLSSWCCYLTFSHKPSYSCNYLGTDWALKAISCVGFYCGVLEVRGLNMPHFWSWKYILKTMYQFFSISLFTDLWNKIQMTHSEVCCCNVTKGYDYFRKSLKGTWSTTYHGGSNRDWWFKHTYYVLQRGHICIAFYVSFQVILLAWAC